jgi:signal recognition particle GTPase
LSPNSPKTVDLAQRIRVKSQCEGLKGGVPLRYKVPFKTIENNPTKKLRVMTVDSASQPNVPEKRILLVGGTGSGKTTWLNGVANYLYGVSWTDDIRFKVVGVDDETGKSGSRGYTGQ